MIASFAAVREDVVTERPRAEGGGAGPLQFPLLAASTDARTVYDRLSLSEFGVSPASTHLLMVMLKQQSGQLSYPPIQMAASAEVPDRAICWVYQLGTVHQRSLELNDAATFTAGPCYQCHAGVQLSNACFLASQATLQRRVRQHANPFRPDLQQVGIES